MINKQNLQLQWKNNKPKIYRNCKFNIDRKDKLCKKTIQIKFIYSKQDSMNLEKQEKQKIKNLINIYKLLKAIISKQNKEKRYSLDNNWSNKKNSYFIMKRNLMS